MYGQCVFKNSLVIFIQIRPRRFSITVWPSPRSSPPSVKFRTPTRAVCGYSKNTGHLGQTAHLPIKLPPLSPRLHRPPPPSTTVSAKKQVTPTKFSVKSLLMPIRILCRTAILTNLFAGVDCSGQGHKQATDN